MCGAAATARTGGPLSPPTSDLEELSWLAGERRRLTGREQQLIVSLVAAGTPWPLIAASLGVSRQAARQRFLRTHGAGQDDGDNGRCPRYKCVQTC